MLAHAVCMLLVMLMLLQTNCNQALSAADGAGSVNAPPTDTFYIRHGRSKVRHSNEKEHLLRSMRPTRTAGGAGAVAVAGVGDGGVLGNASRAAVDDNELNANGNLTAASGSHRLSLFSSSIQSGNGHLFGSDYWQNSNPNGTLINQSKDIQPQLQPQTKLKTSGSEATQLQTASLNYRMRAQATESPDVGSTLAPVTHRIRKLHMKKIMESIRNSVDKSLGVKLSKNHRSLVEAEQLQGRPTDLSEDDEDIDDIDVDGAGVADAADDTDDDDADDDGAENPTNDESNKSIGVADVDVDVDGAGSDVGGDLNEVLQLADELDLPRNAFEDAYQNDEYITTTSSYASTKSSYGADGDDELATVVPAPVAALETSEELKYVGALVGDITTRTTAVPKRNQISHSKSNEWQAANQLPTNHSDAMEYKQKTPNRNKHLSAQHSNVLLSDEAHRSVDAMLEDYSADSNEVLDDIESNDIMSFEMAQNETDEVQEHDNNTEITNNTLDLKATRLVATKELLSASESPAIKTTAEQTVWSADSYSQGPNQLASTSVGGIGLERQSMDLEEINFDNMDLDNVEEGVMDDGHIDNHNANGFPLSVPGDASDGSLAIGDSGGDNEDGYETNELLAGVVDAANEDEIYDWDEISRNNRRNLMRGRDVVTKFLQIVETQHSLGSNCEAGTSLNLGEGVVDRYAQDRFRVEAEVAVNRANMLTRIFKMTAPAVQADVNLLHASVLSMVEFDDDIFAAGNCFDWNEHRAQPGLFCPFAYRLPPPNLGAVLAKDLATEYHYLGNTSEWFFQARKNAEKVIARNEQYLKSFHLYSNKTDERIEDDTLAVKYEDGRWSKPYYDCGGGNIWMLTYTVPFFGYENGTYHFKGTSGIDIDLRRVDIDQCPQRNSPGTTQPLNIFAGTDKCKQRTTMCEALKGLGFRRGSYKCICRKGYYFPDTMSTQKFFNGSLLEEEYEKLMLGKNSSYNIINEYECLPCAEGCESCEDGSPCIAALNWPMRTSILVLACTVIGLLPPAAWFTFRYQQVKVVRAASPALLRVIALGAFFIYCTNIVMYPNPNLYTCTSRIWLREIGFSLTYGALMLKTWRISVIFRVRSAKAVKITDAALLKRLGIICGVIGTCLLVRTLVSPPDVVVGRTADDLKAFLCKTDWWDYTFTSMEVLFLAWGVRLCIMVRKAPSEFNESRFISMAIYNEFLLTCFLNVSMLFLQSPANPDLLYIIFFCHTQLTVTLLLGLIFGSKVYIVLRSGKSHQENIGLGAKSSGAKFNFRPQVRTFANPSSITTSTVPVAGTTSAETKLSDQEALEEIRQLSMQLQRIQEMAPPKGVAVMTISSLLDGLKTPGGMMMVAAAATQSVSTGNQLLTRSQGGGALPLLSLNGEMQKYSQHLQPPQNNNVSGSGKLRQTMIEVETSTTTIEETVQCEERAMNTDLTSAEDFHQQALGCSQGHIICSRCLVISKEHYFSCRPFTPPNTCQQLGSPQQEGSISFANIKLECMCSQSDDLDVDMDVPQRRRANLRTAATNTPPASSGSSMRRRGKTKKTGSNASLHDGAAESGVSYRICDNCKIKYRSNKTGGRKFRKSSKYRNSRLAAMAGDERCTKNTAAGSLSQTCSNDVLDRRLAAAGAAQSAAESSGKKVRSTDDIIFYTTTEESSDTVDDDDDADSSGLRRRRQIICQSTTSLSAAVASCSGGNVNIATVSTATVTHIADDAPGVEGAAAGSVPEAAAVSQSMGNVSTTSNNSNSADNSHSNNDNNAKPNGSGRSKRPDKLLLDLNDRSKYTKEVSV